MLKKGIFLGFDVNKKYSYIIMDIENNKMHDSNDAEFVKEVPSKYKYETSNYIRPLLLIHKKKKKKKKNNRKERNTDGQEKKKIIPMKIMFITTIYRRAFKIIITITYMKIMLNEENYFNYFRI